MCLSNDVIMKQACVNNVSDQSKRVHQLPVKGLRLAAEAVRPMHQRTIHSFPIVHFFQTLLSRLAVFVVQYHIEGGKDALLLWRGKGAMWVRRSSSRFIFMLNG